MSSRLTCYCSPKRYHTPLEQGWTLQYGNHLRSRSRRQACPSPAPRSTTPPVRKTLLESAPAARAVGLQRAARGRSLRLDRISATVSVTFGEPSRRYRQEGATLWTAVGCTRASQCTSKTRRDSSTVLFRWVKRERAFAQELTLAD